MKGSDGKENYSISLNSSIDDFNNIALNSESIDYSELPSTIFLPSKSKKNSKDKDTMTKTEENQNNQINKQIEKPIIKQESSKTKATHSCKNVPPVNTFISTNSLNSLNTSYSYYPYSLQQNQMIYPYPYPYPNQSYSSFQIPIYNPYLIYPQNSLYVSNNNLNQNLPPTKINQVKSTKIEKYIRKHKDIIDILQEEEGCKKITSLIKSSKNSNDIRLLYERIKNSLIIFFPHPITSYFLQEFFEYLTKDQRYDIWNVISDKLNYLTCADYSTHSVQALIKCSSSVEERVFIVKLISPSFDTLCIHKRGNHVLQLIIAEFEAESKLVLEQYIYSNITKITNNIYGICLIKKIIHLLSNQSKEKINYFLNYFNPSFLQIVGNKTGHYVFLYIFEVWNTINYNSIISLIENNLLELCNNKYSFRVIKALIELIPKVSLFILYIRINKKNCQLL